ncbi:MAG: carbohydrate kinase, partial [Bacteroidales bacterium]|nr:carbohydrate kinase [Candidatus Cryptobacteroides aphodequi]
NTFLHVNDTNNAHRFGVLLCINGTGILNSWVHHKITPNLDYAQMNDVAAKAPAGSDGLRVMPFGNGAERVLENRNVGARFSGLDLVRHSTEHILRATQEGIAFSFRYGIDIMRNLGLDPKLIRAGKANLFLSPLFRSTLATLCDANIELLNTDGSLGAARGAALGAGFYSDEKEAFANLTTLETVVPAKTWKEPLEQAYSAWKKELEQI